MERRRMEIEGSFRDHSVIREIVKIVSQVAQALSTSASYFSVSPMRLSCRDLSFSSVLRRVNCETITGGKHCTIFWLIVEMGFSFLRIDLDRFIFSINIFKYISWLVGFITDCEWQKEWIMMGWRYKRIRRRRRYLIVGEEIDIFIEFDRLISIFRSI